MISSLARVFLLASQGPRQAFLFAKEKKRFQGALETVKRNRTVGKKIERFELEQTSKREIRMAGHGKNHLVLGPMFSGKTSELFKVVDRSIRHAKLLVVALKPKVDDRWGVSDIKTHGGNTLSVDALVSDGLECVAVVAEKGREYVALHGFLPLRVVVVVDECQFLKDVAYLARWVKNHKSDLPDVEVEAHYAGLDGTAGEPGKMEGQEGSRVMFPEIVSLLPLCTTITKLNAVCMRCQLRDAAFTRFFGRNDDHVESEDPFLRIGAEESYEAVCEHCDY